MADRKVLSAFFLGCKEPDIITSSGKTRPGPKMVLPINLIDEGLRLEIG